MPIHKSQPRSVILVLAFPVLWTVLQHPLDALRLALDPGNIHPIDIALVNGEVFMNLTTAGPVSEVSSKGMSDALKKALGPAAVAVAGGCNGKLHQGFHCQ